MTRSGPDHMTETLRLDILMLLPDLPDEPDACVQRLEELVARSPGIEQCLTRDSGAGPVLILRYDPRTLTAADVHRLVQAAGEEITGAVGHILLSVPTMVSSDVQHIEDGLRALVGVLSVSVDPGAECVQVEFLRRDLSATIVVQHLQLLGQSDAALLDPFE